MAQPDPASDPRAFAPLAVGIARTASPAAPELVVKVTFDLGEGPSAIATVSAEQVPFLTSLGEGEATLSEPLEPDARLVVTRPDGREARVALPGLVPRAFWIAGRSAERSPIPLRCASATIDAARQVAVLTYRGVFERRRLDPSEAHALVYLDSARKPRSVPDDYATIRFAFATEAADLRPGAEPPDEAELMLLRMSWSSAPSVPLDVYAALSAEIAERREPATTILTRYGLDTASFALLEQHWLEKMATQAQGGDPALAVAFGEVFVAAQDALATPEELARTKEEYAAIRARVERADEPMQALAPRGLSLSEWMRLDRRFAREIEARPELEPEIERLVAAEHEKLLASEGPSHEHELEPDGGGDE